MLLLFPLGASGQTVTYSWAVFTREDGLISNNVFSVLPTSGAVWFGTDAGISRFDGDWQSWPSGDGFEGTVRALVSDGDDETLWAGTDGGFILRWRSGLWETVATVPASVQSLLASDGQLWIGTRRGLFVWNEGEPVRVDELGTLFVTSIARQANSLWVGTDEGLWLRQRNTWNVTRAGDGLPGDEITALWVDPEGPIWVAANFGLAWRDVQTGAWNQVSTETLQLPIPEPIVSLTGEPGGNVWGGTYGNGPFRVTESRETLITLSGSSDAGLTTPFIQAVAIDDAGSVWFGTVSGVFRFDQKMWVREFRGPVLRPGINSINSLLIDRENQLWIGTQGAGIRLKTDMENFEDELYFDDLEGGLPSNFVSDMVEDETGTIWAGTLRGLGRFDPATFAWEIPVAVERLPSPLVSALISNDPYLWIGTDKGLARYHPATDEMVPIEPLDQLHVQELALDSQRRLWVGTLTAGVFISQEDGSWLHQTPDSLVNAGFSPESIPALAADPNVSGGMWMGIQQEGIAFFDGSEWLDVTPSAELPSKVLYDFFTDPADGSLWIGSEGGVTRYDGLTWETLSVDAVLPNASIYAIARTREGSYWFGGKEGLTFYRPETTPPWIEISNVSGAVQQPEDGRWQVEVGRELTLSYRVGDLHTPSTDMKVLYRLYRSGQAPESWQVLDEPVLQLADLTEEGAFVVELQARDRAFNYSEITRVELNVTPSPALLDLPFLAPIQRDYFIALFVTGLIALIGLAYMVAELSQSRRRGIEALNRGFNPFVSGEPVRRQDMFFGRHNLLQRIVDTLHNNSIMIHGERRIGKTTLLYQLAGRLREVDDPEYWFVPLYIDLEGTEEEIFFHFLIDEIHQGVTTLPSAEEMAPVLSDLLYRTIPANSYSDRDFSRDLRSLIRALHTYAETHQPGKLVRLILLLDEMDVMSEYSRLLQQRLRRIFMRDFAATLGAIVAGIQINKDWDRIESPWYNLFNEIELKPFDQEMARELLTEPIEEIYRYEPEALDFIIQHSDGRPYRLQQYALEAVNHMLAQGRRTIEPEDVEFAHEHIQNVGDDTFTGIRSRDEDQLTGASVDDDDPSGQERQVPVESE